MKKFVTICLVLFMTMGGIAQANLVGPVSTSPTGYGDAYGYLINRSCVIDLGPATAGGMLTGTVSNLAFGSPGDSASGSWFEIGFIAKYVADLAIDTYGWPPYMFNQSAFLVAYKTSAGNLLVMPADTDMGYTPVGPNGPKGGGINGNQYFDLGTGVNSFSFVLNVVPDGSGAGGDIILAVAGQTGTKIWKYGYENWNWFSYEVEFAGDYQLANCIAQGYANAPNGSVYAEVDVICVPEPATICLIGLGILGLLRKNSK